MDYVVAVRPRPRLWITAVAAVSLLAVGCSDEVALPTPIEAAAAERQSLLDNGVAAPIADCVARLAERPLRTGPLSDVAREELVAGCTQAQAVIDAESAAADADAEPAADLAFVGPFTHGDDARLDLLWEGCEQGSGADCDTLFEESPIGSEYEAYGVSCGERETVVNCSELDEEPKAPEPAVYQEMLNG